MDDFPNPSKEQLIDVVQRHFMSQVLSIFIHMFPFSVSSVHLAISLEKLPSFSEICVNPFKLMICLKTPHPSTV